MKMRQVVRASLVLSLAGLTACDAVDLGYQLESRERVESSCSYQVEGNACAFTQGGWGQACSGNNVGCHRDLWFAEVFPQGMKVGTVVFKYFVTSQEVEDFLPQGGSSKNGVNSAFFGQMTALKLNLEFDQAGAFGAGGLATATLKNGPYAGWNAAALLSYAESLSPASAPSGLTDSMAAFNEGFEGCDLTSFPAPGPTDLDQDGVPEEQDCDDQNPLVGALLYENHFDSQTGYFQNTATLQDPWTYEARAGFLSTTQGGQQAQLGASVDWTNTVTFATVSAHGALNDCPECEGPTDRFRVGILARAEADADQGEGFHGYRCAVARNAGDDCATPGSFVQLAAFLDKPEDNLSSECDSGCPTNSTFDQLGRVERSEETDVLAGESARLTFWAVGEGLACEFEGEKGEKVVSRGTDTRFAKGGTGLSTLNALGDFDTLKVCQAFGIPAPQ